MIVTRTPLRISFFGGGTDYPQYFLEHGGEVIATAIDKYVYFTISHLGNLFDHKIRVAYSKTELVNHADEIQHRAIREALRYMGVTKNIEINNIADLPARTGLGSSSAFMVGLLHALHAYRGQQISPHELAYQAIEIEQNRLGDSVGCQDQFVTATGGFCHIQFIGRREIRVRAFEMDPERKQRLGRNLVLLYTGLRRSASEVAQEQIGRTSANLDYLHSMKSMVADALGILASDGDLNDFGRLLDETWKIKRGLSSKITNAQIDEIYNRARQAGAIGGKLLGAGGGGFFLFYVEQSKQRHFEQEMSPLQTISFCFELEGSKVIYAKERIHEMNF